MYVMIIMKIMSAQQRQHVKQCNVDFHSRVIGCHDACAVAYNVSMNAFVMCPIVLCGQMNLPQV